MQPVARVFTLRAEAATWGAPGGATRMGSEVGSGTGIVPAVA